MTRRLEEAHAHPGSICRIVASTQLTGFPGFIPCLTRFNGVQSSFLLILLRSMETGSELRQAFEIFLGISRC